MISPSTARPGRLGLLISGHFDARQGITGIVCHQYPLLPRDSDIQFITSCSERCLRSGVGKAEITHKKEWRFLIPFMLDFR